MALDPTVKNMDADQVAYLKKQLDEWEKAKADQATGNQALSTEPAQVTVSLPNGQQVTGTNEQISAAFAEYQKQAQAGQPAPTQQQQGQVSESGQERVWGTQNQEKFADLASKDFKEAMDYYFQEALGYHPQQAIQMLTMGMAKMAERIQSTDQHRFAAAHNMDAETFDAVKKVVEQNGWPMDEQNLMNAYHVAKGQGLLQNQATPTPTPGVGPTPVPTPQFPPRVGNPSEMPIGDPNGMDPELVQRFEALDTDDMRSFLINAQNKMAAQRAFG